VLKRYAYIREQLAEIGLTPVALTLSDRQAWTITTDGGHEILLAAAISKSGWRVSNGDIHAA